MISNASPKKPAPVVRRAFKINEVARQLGVSDLTIRRLIERGQLKAIRPLRHVLILATEVDRFLSG